MRLIDRDRHQVASPLNGEKDGHKLALLQTLRRYIQKTVGAGFPLQTRDHTPILGS